MLKCWSILEKVFKSKVQVLELGLLRKEEVVKKGRRGGESLSRRELAPIGES